MSFLKITDPEKRDLRVKELVDTRKRIPDNLLQERTGELTLQKDLSTFFKPVTDTQKETTEKLAKNIKESAPQPFILPPWKRKRKKTRSL